MANISHIELENLRHLITDEQVASSKCSFYADSAQHPELKKMFSQGAKDAQSNVQKLKQFLQ